MSERSPTLTGRGQAFLALGLVTAVAGMLLGFPDATRIGVLLSVLPVLALLTTLRRPPRVTVSRQVHPPRLQPGERAEVRVDFQNAGRGRTPLALAEERIDYALGDRPRFVLPRMDRGEMRHITYSIRSHVRGRYRLGPVALTHRDPFGLTHVARHLPEHTEVLVLPPVEVVGPGRPRGEGRGSEGEVPHMVALHGEDDVSIRSYRDGDDLRRVHWPATAHRGELMVRQEDRPARRRAVLVLDPRRRAHQGSGTASSFEWAVSATASIGLHLCHQGYAVHLVCAESVTDGSAAQPMDADAILTTLAVARPGDRRDLDAVVRAAHPLVTTGGALIAVAAGHDERAMRALSALREPGSAAVALLLDTGTFAQAATSRHTERPGEDLAHLLRSAGWSTHLVGAGTSVAQAWASATAPSSLSGAPS